MGDIPLGCVVYRYFNVDVDRPALHNVEAWYQRLSERPAYRDHVMRHFGTNPDEWAALEKACASEGVILSTQKTTAALWAAFRPGSRLSPRLTGMASLGG